MHKHIIKYIKENKTTFAKFLVVGGSSTVIDYGISFLMIDILDIFYLIGISIAFIFAAGYNYTFNRRWTFQSGGDKKKQLPVFFGVAIVGLVLNNSIVALGVEQFDLYWVFPKIVATAAVTFWNFFGNKYLTFRIE